MECVICNGVMNKMQYKVFKCQDCHHTYIDYSEDGINYHKLLYRAKGQEGTRAGDVEEGKFTDKFHERRTNICERRVTRISDLLEQADSLLDIGAGGGTFLKMVQPKVKLVEGTEVSDICYDNLTDLGFKVYHGAFTKIDIDNVYDLVTCWHVLEHIKDVKAFPEKAYKYTKDYLVVEVPIKRRLRNPDTDFDGHFHYFSEKSLNLLFSEFFDTISIKEGIQKPSLLGIFRKKK